MNNPRPQTPDSEPLYPIADTHTHLYFSAFDGDREMVLENCSQQNVGLQVQIGCDEVSSIAAIELAHKYPEFYATVGLHPCDVKTCFNQKREYRPAGYEDYTLRAQNFDQLFDLFDQLITENPKKVVGLGETGFDLYHENSDEILRLQWDCFERHIVLAKKHDLPIVIHTRNARQTLRSFLQSGKMQGIRSVVHCFSEDVDFAQIMTQEYGFSLGIGGVATYPKSQAVREAIEKTPIQYLLTETDAPFLVPHQARKEGVKRNDASYISEVVRLIANIKGLPEEECGHRLFENAKDFYQI